MAITANGEPLVVYVEHPTKDTGDVWLQKLGPDARAAGERVRVNPNDGEAKTWYGDPPVVKLGSDNAGYITWTAQSASGVTDIYLYVSRDGGAKFDAPVKVYDDEKASPGLHSLAVGPNGEIFVDWLDDRGIKKQEEM